MKYVLCLLFLFAVLCLNATADIQVTYTGFNAQQQAAFDHAMALWEPILNSAIPIKVNARLQNIPGFVSVPIPNMIRNFPGAPQQDVWYCTALANALTGVEQNVGETDIEFFVSSSAANNWYYGLDEACPAGSIDFVTEMHKALAYGLGYMGSFYVQTGYGSYGMLDPSVLGLSTSFPADAMSGKPALYDTFICNTMGQHLTDTTLFSNPSPALNAQLTGGNLRYVGQYGNAFSPNGETVLYAGAFNLARTAKLDAATYLGTENEPGIPTAYNGTVHRYIAPIVLGIMKDMGWTLSLNSCLMCPIITDYGLEGSDVYLMWEEIATPYDIDLYAIRRNGELIAEVASTNFTDYNPPAGDNYYSVCARYSMGWSAMSPDVMVSVPVGVEDETAVSASGASLGVYPNPMRNNCRIQLGIKSDAVVSMELFDLKGRLCDRIEAVSYHSGLNDVSWNSAKLGSGIYFLRCRIGDEQLVRKLMVIK